jgi:hypothetical protein
MNYNSDRLPYWIQAKSVEGFIDYMEPLNTLCKLSFIMDQ